MLNSYEACYELLEKRSMIYADRWFLLFFGSNIDSDKFLKQATAGDGQRIVGEMMYRITLTDLNPCVGWDLTGLLLSCRLVPFGRTIVVYFTGK
jgi:hypothetical protein